MADWRCERRVSDIVYWYSWSASSDIPGTIQFSDNGGLLVCKGIYLGRIESVGSLLDWHYVKTRELTFDDSVEYFQNIVAFAISTSVATCGNYSQKCVWRFFICYTKL